MNKDEQALIVDAIQKATVRLVATSPAGYNLLLIGGFRYRFLDRSARTSTRNSTPRPRETSSPRAAGPWS